MIMSLFLLLMSSSFNQMFPQCSMQYSIFVKTSAVLFQISLITDVFLESFLLGTFWLLTVKSRWSMPLDTGGVQVKYIFRAILKNHFWQITPHINMRAAKLHCLNKLNSICIVNNTFDFFRILCTNCQATESKTINRFLFIFRIHLWLSY